MVVIASADDVEEYWSCLSTYLDLHFARRQSGPSRTDFDLFDSTSEVVDESN